jgi:uncharacterized protein YhaN
MRLNSLNLMAYGPFTGRRLDFTAPFTIAYGLNEAGKSSALRALLDALYGIPAQTPDDFLHPYNSLRIGFELAAGSERIGLIRRKGRQQTLRAEDDITVVDDSVLARALQGVGRETFASMFGITHETLVEGGQALAEGKGEIGKLLFVSAAGLTGIQDRLAAIEQEAAELYSPRGKKMSIQQCLRELREAEDEFKKAQVVLSKFQENRKALDEVARALVELETQAEAGRRELERLSRISRALPTISERRQASDELASLPPISALLDDFGDRLRDAGTRMRLARDAQAEHAKDLAQLDESIAARHVPQEVLAEDEAIRTLFEQKGEIRKSRQDCLRTEAKLGEAQRSVMALAGRLRPGAGLEEAAGMEPGLLARNRVQELMPIAVRLEADRDALGRGLQETRGKLDECEAQIARCPEAPDITLLAAAVNRVHRTIDARRARELRRKLTTAEAALSTVLRSLPWNGSAEELEAMSAPSSETVEEFREAFQSVASAERSAREKIADVDRQLTAARGERERLVALEGVPTMGELADARALRDSGWNAVKSTWKTGNAEEEHRFLARTGQSDLADAYEGAVAGADHVADRLRDNAQRVEQLAALEAGIVALDNQRVEGVKGLEAAVRDAESLRERWTRAWLGCGIVPESAPAMQGWLRRRDDAAQQARAVWEIRLELEALEADEAALANELRRALEIHVGLRPGELSELLATAEVVLGNATKLQERRQGALALRDAQRLEIARIERDLVAAGERSSEWSRNWAAALTAAGLPADLTPAGAELYLDTAAEIAAGLGKIEDYRHRIGAMRADADGFASAVAALCRRLSPASAALEAESAIAQLHQALAEAHQNRKLLEQEQKQRKEIEKKLAAADRAATQCASELQALCREARADTIDAARESWSLWGRRQKLDALIAEFDERLRLVSAGKTVQEFLAEAVAVDADALPGRIEGIRKEILDVGERRTSLEERRRALDADGHAMQGGDVAASIKQRMSGLVGRLAGDVEQYVRLRTATFVIRKAMDRYRDRNQGPVLERAARVFAGLTCGSFASLRVENEEGTATLVGVRPDGRTVPLEGMSDGTLDQLYLALRIASLEHYFAAHEPAPFIVDDILLNFDDERAAAALEALNAVSEKTQVILFTHHHRLVELAQGRTKAVVQEIGT